MRTPAPKSRNRIIKASAGSKVASRRLVIPSATSSPPSSSLSFFFPPAEIHLLALFSEQLSSTCHPATTSQAASAM